MASKDKDPDPGRGQLSPDERDALRRRASEIGSRLDEVRARRAQPSGDPKSRGAALGQAFRILTELVVGVVVGGGIGWFLDRQLGTGGPWFLFVFLILGFTAGMSNVVRTARRMQAQAEPLQRAAKPVVDDAGDDEDGPPAGSPGSRSGGTRRG